MRLLPPTHLAVLLASALGLHCGGDGGATASNQAAPGSDAGDGANPDAGDLLDAACAAPGQLCGGVCTDTDTDPGSCGTCGHACDQGQGCCGGSCSTTCNLSISSLSATFGPLSGGTFTTIKGSGFAPGARVSFGGSRVPAMVVDASTIQVQTTPHLEAKVDVRVEQGADVATRSQAFQFASYSFDGPWQKISMTAPRGSYPGVSVMMDGRVLVTGGRTLSNNTSLLSTADLYDPTTSTTSPTAGELAAARVFVTQVTLLTGKVLVVGTDNAYVANPNAELFDPATSTFRATAGQPPVGQNRAFAAMLPDGRVLVTSQTTAGALIYDPMADGFSPVPNAPNAAGYEPVLLPDGRVLLVAGNPLGAAYLYDPQSGSFTAAGPSPEADASTSVFRGAQRAFAIPDGRVISLGGYGSKTIALFDPNAPGDGFVTAPYSLAEPLHYTSITLMGDGTVFVLGGATTATGDCGGSSTWVLTDMVERIDPVAGTIGTFDKLPEAAMDLGAVTLLDGSVIAGGGEVCGGAPTHPYLYFLKGKVPAIF